MDSTHHNRNVPSHHKPFPEIVEPQPGPNPYWIIDTIGKPWLPTNGMTSLKERKLMVPLAPGAVSVARHELAHVKWSPQQLPKVDFDLRFLMAIEDARINLGLLWIDLPVQLTPKEKKDVAALAQQDLASKDVLSFLLRSIAAQGTDAEANVLGELRTQPQAVLDFVYGHVRRVRIRLLRARRARQADVAGFETAQELAAELAREVEAELKKLGFPGALPPMNPQGIVCCLGHGALRRGAKSRHGRGIRVSGEDSSTECVSGEMRMTLPPLPYALPPSRLGRRGRLRPVSEGSVPRYLHRWAVDRAIFRHAARSRGGTVLVDTSGSMSIDAAGVDQILTASSGAALIAIYSGSEKEGELRIVARDGRRADAKDLIPFGRGNIIDEPALSWLARQDGPRVWISDGGVTGVGDRTSGELQHRCQEIVQRARIQRVKTVQKAAAFLARGGGHAGVA